MSLRIPGAPIAAKVAMRPLGYTRAGRAVWPIAGGSPTLTMDSKDLKAQRTALIEEMNALVDKAKTENRELTDEERADLHGKDERIVALDDDIPTAERMEARTAELAASEPGDGKLRIKVGAEENVYRPGGEHRFMVDAFRAKFSADAKAGERLGRHNEMRIDEYFGNHPEYRDVGTGAFTGLVVPQYLIDLVAPFTRAGRVFADLCRGIPLPDEGLVLNVSRITTGTAVAAQATENAAVQETDADDTLLAVNVRTYAGMQDVSRQALDRGQMIEEILIGDLLSAYHTTLDSALINADGTGGTHLGVRSTGSINTVTYTDATPTLGELYPKFADAWQRVNTIPFLNADLAVMHPRRWAWALSALDTQGRPLVVAEAGAVNAMGVGQAGVVIPTVGSFQGIPVALDANIPTTAGAGTEDVILVLNRSNCILFELPGEPFQLRFEETLGGNLTVKLVVFSYSAFTAGRYPAASSLITGTGLIAPVF